MFLRQLICTALSLAALLSCGAAFAGEPADYGNEDYSSGSYKYVTLNSVQEAFIQLGAALDGMEQDGTLTTAAAQRLRLLLGGLFGSLEQNASEYYADLEMSAGAESPAPAGGPAPDSGYYYKVTPSRQITLYTGPGADNVSAEGEAGKEVSVWIDEFGTVYVSGDSQDPDSLQQLNLKPGWEQDYDKLSTQIQEMLTKFMQEHADEQGGEL